MPRPYDVIILGLGGMGSATAYQLALRGQRVLGLERYTKAHDRGSSHGLSRIIRQAYFEDPAYVPLLLRAYELWRQIERDSGRPVLFVTGGLMIGPPESHVVAGAIRSAREWNLAHEVLSASEIRRRFPVFTPAGHEIALYEAPAGYLLPEASVAAHLDQAAAHGADLHFEEPALSWEAAPGGEGVRVTTAQGTYEAGHLVLSPGPWAPEVLQDLNLPLEVERQVLHWFAPAGGIAPFLPDRCPIYIWEVTPEATIYGFPAHDGPDHGAKVAFFRVPGPHHICTPETIDRRVHDDEIALMRDYIADRLPLLNGEHLFARTCMYTNTPDEHFVIATLPGQPQVAFAAGFSGHGYKFASVIGEIMADLATSGTTHHSIALFTPARFAVQQ